MPRFVVLEHDHPIMHWDLMLELGTALRTWRLSAPPTDACIVAATALGEHRLAYLDYEGPVSGGRGSVRRWDQGVFELYVEEPGRLVAGLDGQRLCGDLVVQLGAEGWTATFHQRGGGGCAASVD